MTLNREITKKILDSPLAKMTASLHDKSLIEDTVAIKSTITKIEQHLLKYSISNIFEIVVPDSNNPKSVTTMNLFQNHYGVMPKMVATSNQMRCMYLHPDLQDLLDQDMMLSFEFFQNNAEETLFDKIMEGHGLYKESEKGGLLFYIIAIEHIQQPTEQECIALQEKLCHMKLFEIKGKSVEHAVMLIRSIIQFLKNAHKSTLQDGKELYKYLPVDLVQIVLNIFKISSIKVFNSTLDTIKELAEFGDTNDGDMSSFNLKDDEQLLCMAESQYIILFQKGEWTGINTPGLSSFTATGGSCCWNCGETGTMLDDCPRSCDNAAIEHNKQVFWHAKGGCGGGRSYGCSRGQRGRGHSGRGHGRG